MSLTSLIHKIEINPPSILRKTIPNGYWIIKNSEKKIYLTFDDGPIPDVTEWVLDVLKQYNIKATFFCVGENVFRNPQIYQRIINEGHKTGCHTYNHLNAWKVKKQFYIDNIAKAENYISSNLFRPPHGKMRPTISRYLHKKNYKLILWDVVSRDYDKTLEPENCLNYIKKYTRQGSIIVFHDSLKAEKNLRFALPKAIEYLLAQGFVFDIIK